MFSELFIARQRVWKLQKWLFWPFLSTSCMKSKTFENLWSDHCHYYFKKCRVKYWYFKYQNAAMKPPGIHHSRPKNCFCSFSYQVIALSFFFPKWSHPLFKSPYFKFYEHLRTGYISKYSYTMHPTVCWWNLFSL